VDDVIWTLNEQGQFTFISPSLKTLLGHEPEQWIGKALHCLLTPNSASCLDSVLEQGIQQLHGEDCGQSSCRVELEHLHRDGSRVWAEITLTPLGRRAEQPQAFVGVTRDIRVRKLYEQNLREARDAAEEANSALLTANALLHDRATTDELTGLCNRRHFEEILQTHMKTSAENDQGTFLLVIDVDNFKLINDQLGHTVGDRILVEVSNLLAARLRKFDQLARWGGDEFIMTIARLQPDDALELANRLCDSVSAYRFPEGWPVTLSIGLAECRPRENLEQWFDRADSALYAVKAAGRNAAKLST